MKFPGQARYYPKKILILKPDVPGARMWSVSLQKTMLTYFEVNPDSRFESHSHASEQITLVLEGELFFEVNERVLRLKRGDALAIPSRVPHSTFTKHRPAKAVDAWSPVMKKYKN